MAGRLGEFGRVSIKRFNGSVGRNKLLANFKSVFLVGILALFVGIHLLNGEFGPSVPQGPLPDVP